MKKFTIVAVSDLHGHLPALPKGDLLLVAGDICPDFIARSPQRAWFVDKFLPYLKGWEGQKFLTWGNHDWLPNPSREWSDLVEAQGLVRIDELVEWNGIKIWFSPWSNQFGYWAWMAEPKELAQRYESIPEGVDILVSHQPPFGYGDEPDPKYILGAPGHVGSHELLVAVTRAKPKVVICGHIHGGFGVYKHLDSQIFNVSLVNEAYRPVNGVTVIPWEVDEQDNQTLGPVADDHRLVL